MDHQFPIVSLAGSNTIVVSKGDWLVDPGNTTGNASENSTSYITSIEFDSIKSLSNELSLQMVKK